MKLDFALLSKYADMAADATINMMGADFDQLQVDKFPCSPHITLVAKFSKEREDEEPAIVSVILVDPAGNRVDVGPKRDTPRQEAPSKSKTSGVLIVTIGLYLNLAGTYHVHLGLNGSDVAVLPFDVSVAEREQPESKTV